MHFLLAVVKATFITQLAVGELCGGANECRRWREKQTEAVSILLDLHQRKICDLKAYEKAIN